MIQTELEFTYLAREIPEGLASCPSKLIVDVYYPAGRDHATLRVRQRGDHYEITKKFLASGTDSSHLLEHTIELDEEEYKGLTQNPGKRVAKRRYLYEYQGRTAEIDVFEGELAGLVEVDVEFDNRDEQLAFGMPDFCLADVTQEVFAAGGSLAGKSYTDIAPHLEKYDYKPLKLESEHAAV
jgi:CYTH domain-containing protein